MQRCMGCRKVYKEEDTMCPYCGYINSRRYSKEHSIPHETVLNQRYIVEEILEKDQIGFTYLVWDALSEKNAVVKEFCPLDSQRTEGGLEVQPLSLAEDLYKKLVDQFLNTAEKLKGIEGLNEIPVISEMFRENNTGYYVLTQTKGCTLQSMLERENPIGEERVYQLMERMALGVWHLSEANLIHGNLTPHNIFFEDGGGVKFLNFSWDSEEIKALGYSLFSSSYTPPEAGENGTGYGTNSDKYSLFGVCCRAVTGMEPMEAKKRKKALMAWPQACGIEVPPKVEHMLRKGMSMNPDRRSLLWEDAMNTLKNTVSLLEKGEWQSVYQNVKGEFFIYKALNSLLALIVIILGIVLLV